MNILIKNGRVVDPANSIDAKLDVLIEDSTIKAISSDIPRKDTLTIDASNKLVVPGLIDAHVHFREPGFEHKETIKTGSRAAAAGGFTTVICQPNTKPPVDGGERVKLVMDIAKRSSLINLYTRACITKGMRGKELVNMEEVKEAGAIGITDDGNAVISEELMRRAFREAKSHDLHVSPHCGNGLPETEYIKRDIKLAKEVDWPVHILHVSLKNSVEIIAEAKAKGWPVSCEVTPHHFTLTKENESRYGTDAKMNPPLANEEDIMALKKGLADGIIDIIATDHAPHTPEEKAQKWDSAPFGVIGLETCLGLVLTELVHKNFLSLSSAIEKMTINPARILGLKAGTLSVGMPADITIIDPEKEWTVDVNKFESKGRNCPFHGWKLKGKAIMTILRGKMIMKDERIL